MTGAVKVRLWYAFQGLHSGTGIGPVLLYGAQCASDVPVTRPRYPGRSCIQSVWLVVWSSAPLSGAVLFSGAPASRTGASLVDRRAVHRGVGAGARIHSGRSRAWRGSRGRSTLAE